jgi:glycosyltransferase involved in cell wall biosynthesis
MDVIFVGSRGIPAKYGGNETFVEEVSKRLLKSGLKIGVVCEDRRFFMDEYNGITRIHTFSFQGKGLTIPFVNDIISTIYLLVKHNNETNIFYYVTPDGSLSGVIARAFGKKVIVNTDGVEWKRLLKRMHYAPFYMVPIYLATMVAMYFAEYLACKISHITIADSKAIKEHLKRHSPKNVVFIAYGARGMLPDDMPCGKQEEILRDFGVVAGQYYLTVGRVVPENNMHYEISGFYKAHSRKMLLIIGDFDNKSGYVKYLHELKETGENVLFHNPVYDQEVLGVLRKHCFGYIHAYEVGGTNPSLLEQMLYEKPILAYDVPFNREVLQEGGIYFSDACDLAVKMGVLENDEFDVELLKTKQRLRLAEQYNWEMVAQDYKNLFRGIND